MYYRPYKKIQVRLIGGAVRQAQLFDNNTARVNIQINGKLVSVRGEIIDGNFYSIDSKYDSYLKNFKRQRYPVSADTKEEYFKIIRNRHQNKTNKLKENNT